MIEVQASQIIEVEVVSGTSKYFLREQELLYDKPIKSIVAYKTGKGRDGNAIQDPSNVYLNLFERQSNDIRIIMPLRSVMYDPGVGAFPILQFIEIGNRPFRWEQSYVEFGDVADVVSGSVIQLLVIYDFTIVEPQYGRDQF